MTRIRTSMKIEEDIVRHIDSLRPEIISRSDVFNAVFRYIMQNPQTLEHLIKCEVREVEYKLAAIPSG